MLFSITGKLNKIKEKHGRAVTKHFSYPNTGLFKAFPPFCSFLSVKNRSVIWNRLHRMFTSNVTLGFVPAVGTIWFIAFAGKLYREEWRGSWAWDKETLWYHPRVLSNMLLAARRGDTGCLHVRVCARADNISGHGGAFWAVVSLSLRFPQG